MFQEITCAQVCVYNVSVSHYHIVVYDPCLCMSKNIVPYQDSCYTCLTPNHYYLHII